MAGTHSPNASEMEVNNININILVTMCINRLFNSKNQLVRFANFGELKTNSIMLDGSSI